MNQGNINGLISETDIYIMAFLALFRIFMNKSSQHGQMVGILSLLFADDMVLLFFFLFTNLRLSPPQGDFSGFSDLGPEKLDWECVTPSPPPPQVEDSMHLTVLLTGERSECILQKRHTLRCHRCSNICLNLGHMQNCSRVTACTFCII